MALSPTTFLDPIEEPFDPVAGAVEIRLVQTGLMRLRLGQDVGPCAFLHGELPGPIGVVATVGNQHLPGSQMRQQFSSKSIVTGLTRRQCQP